MSSDPFVIAGRTFASRLIVGTGKYPSNAVMAQAHAASGADMVTVAVRRVNLNDRSGQSLMDFIDRDRMFILPNTAACYTADEAVRTAHLAREAELAAAAEWWRTVFFEMLGPLRGVVDVIGRKTTGESP